MTDNFCEDHEYAYAGDECPFCKQSIGIDTGCDCCPGPVCSATEQRIQPRDRAVELMADERLIEIEEEFHESSERLRHLDAIIAHAQALERLYDEDKMVERQVVQEIRLKAKQLRG